MVQLCSCPNESKVVESYIQNIISDSFENHVDILSECFIRVYWPELRRRGYFGMHPRGHNSVDIESMSHAISRV